ncbi:MAG: type I polyketide synthase [Candidatus Promineifilaceae bacterium]
MNNQTILDNLEGTEIAVIGMAGRFPGAQDIEQYWRNLYEGIEAVTFYTDEELRAAGVPENLLRHPHYVKSGAPLADMEKFDASFFGFGPRDAAIMDPQHRHFLEVAWTALEHAGYDPARAKGAVGVFGGSGHNAYMPLNLLTNPDLVQSVGFFLLRHTGNDKDFLTTRVSYLFDLKGPSVNVQTACSTSLVAIHMASQSLLNGECDMALAGGVTIELPHRQGYLYHEGEILSPDGHCRAFDARSEGTIFGSGVGVVVLKRLADAIEDGDTIHAVVKGSAVNNDGAGKVNYLAPSVDGQAAAIAEAIALAGVEADTIDYVEAHGTGTRIGDPIEVTALTQAFRQTTDKKQFAGIGSVKTNIGHLDTAAGIASFIKVVQALKHEVLPATLNFEAPNPMIDFENSPFFVNYERRPWPRGSKPRRAGISSLGVGGTNAHIIVEEAPVLPPSDEAKRPYFLLPLSAKTPSALDKATANLADFFRQNPGVKLADAAYTLQVGRQQMAYRRIVAVKDTADAADVLQKGDRQRIFSQKAAETAPSVVFMFPGGGAQYPNMGRDLYETEPVYKAVIDECLQLVQGYLAGDLRSLMFCDPTEAEEKAVILQRPSLALPALFMTEVALARLLISWGIEPVATTGHSMGEYTSAHLAGVLSLADALKIVTWRGQLFETLPAGSMLSVELPEEKVRPLLVDDLDIAVINAPELCVVSGRSESIEKMAALLDEKSISYRRIKIDVAAHSSMLDPILEEFGRRLRTIQFHPPQKPYISNVTGTWVRPEDATNPDYWVRHLRHTVRFAEGVGKLLEEPNRVLVEVGPGKTLSSLVRMHPAKGHNHTTFNAMRHPKEAVSDVAFTLTALGKLWLAGVPMDWDTFYGDEVRYRIPLPTYPFERQRYWIEPGTTLYAGAVAAPNVLAKMPNLDDWFYKPVWQQTKMPPLQMGEPLRWLIFQDEMGLGEWLAARLRAEGHDVVTAVSGERFRRQEHQFTLNPRARVDYDTLFNQLQAEGRTPQRIVHLWTVNARRKDDRPMDYYYRNQDLGFYSLFFMAQVLGESALGEPVTIHVFTNGTQQVTSELLANPEKATLMGPVQVIPREFPELHCRLVDLPVLDNGRYDTLLPAILTEIQAVESDPIIALRQNERWALHYEPAKVTDTPPEQAPIRQQGVYLITGGLGGIGLVTAEFLAETAHARLALLSRNGLPPREEWDAWVQQHGSHDRTSRQIRQVQALEEAGAEVLVVAADVTSRTQLTTAVSHIKHHFGGIHGVIHAAGVLADNLISLKTPEEADRVLAPKVRGALLLSELLAGDKLDFFVAFSSTSTALGSAGQVDYVAANAFLNAFAYKQTAVTGTPTIAINWGVWQQVGMAVEAARRQGLVTDEAQPVGPDAPHPLLARFVVDSSKELTYATDFRVKDFWVLDEHRIKEGEALIPGTGFLELARAALNRGDVAGTADIRELFFLSPLAVAGDETREVRVSLTANGEGFTFLVTSKTAVEKKWQEHVRGKVLPLTDVPSRLDIAAVAARCQKRTVTFAPGEQETRQEAFLAFGPRWKNLRQIHFGDGEALALLELPETFADDLARFGLHPALMDLATSFGLPLLAGYEEGDLFYVPLSYKRVLAYRPLSRRIYSYARPHGEASVENEVPTFDVVITDEDGRVLVEIDQFMMKRVGHVEMAASLRKDAGKTAVSLNDEQSLLQLALTDGIAPDEGKAAFRRVLAHPQPQIYVTSLDLHTLMAQNEQAEEEEGGLKLSRPELQSDYEAPRNSIEETLAKIWQELLGIDRVGIHDDFFDLGGHSLIAVRLFARVKKAYNIDLSLATLFEAPTIADFAAFLQAQYGVHSVVVGAGSETAVSSPGSPTEKKRVQPARQEWSPLVAIQPKGTKRPFFCVHGGFGNVLNFYDLTRYLGPDQPFYGLQAYGVDGKKPPLRSIPKMAARYIEAMRQVQPEGPYFMGGFSMGGEVAFEMAQQLTAAGEEVGLVVLLDTIDPGRVRLAASFGTTLAAVNGQFALGPMPEHGPDLQANGHNKPVTAVPQGRLQRVTRRSLKGLMRSGWGWLNGRTKRLRKRVRVQLLNWQAMLYLKMGRTLPQALISPYLWEAHTEALLAYTPGPYRGKVVLFRASETAVHAAGNMGLSWAKLVPEHLIIHQIEGTHNIVKEPYVAEVATLLKRELDSAQQMGIQLAKEEV